MLELECLLSEGYFGTYLMFFGFLPTEILVKMNQVKKLEAESLHPFLRLVRCKEPGFPLKFLQQSLYSWEMSTKF